MPKHEHTYEIISSGDQTVGRVWWDADEGKLDSDNQRLLSYLKEKSYQGITYHSGVEFLQHLGRILKNGYIHARKVED